MRQLQAWIDSVQAVLSGGARLGDLFGSLVTATWNSAQQTPIRLSRTTRPLAVLCLCATTGGGVSVSPVPITWTWAAANGVALLTITAASGLSSSTDYELTLLAVEG